MMFHKSKFSLILILQLITIFLTGIEAANILFFHQLSSYSHRVAVWPLVEELAARGHSVTFSQMYPNKTPNPNVTEFSPLTVEDVWDFSSEVKDGDSKSQGFNVLTRKLEGGWYEPKRTNIDLHIYGYEVCEKFLSLPETINWVENSQFDLVVIDALYNECAYGLAHKWGAKTIVYYTSHPTGVWGVEPLGYLETGEESWIADECIVEETPMSFPNRLLSILATTTVHLIKEYYYYPKLTHLFKEKLNIKDMPTTNQLVRNTDFAFYNSHFSEELARSLPPMFVSVPALHAWGKEAKPLPKDITDFINSSEHDGFIYVSFGSEADIATSPENFQNIFFDAFAQTNTNFIWKWTGKRNKKMGKNIYTSEWLPQFDILASPKCRGFIGHGGLLGMQEAVLNAVPMIVMPVFAEQGYNAHRLERTGRGIKLEAKTLSAKELKESIENILTDQRYKKNMLVASKQLKDLLNPPLETAVFWTEYVLRNNDLSSLKPFKSTHHYWFQIYMLDIWAFLLFVTGFTLYIFTCSLKYAYIRFYSSTSVNKTKSVQKKSN